MAISLEQHGVMAACLQTVHHKCTPHLYTINQYVMSPPRQKDLSNLPSHNTPKLSIISQLNHIFGGHKICLMLWVTIDTLAQTPNISPHHNIVPTAWVSLLCFLSSLNSQAGVYTPLSLSSSFEGFPGYVI